MSAFWLVLALSFALIALAVLGMAIGAMTTGRCLRGSCGGPDATLPGGERASCAGCPNRRPPRAG